MNDSQYNYAILIGVGVFGILIMIGSFLIMSTTIEKLETIIDGIERMEMYNHTVHIRTAEDGFYRTNTLFCAWVKNRKVDEVYITVQHELSGHHNITMDKLAIETQAWIDMDYGHFCQGKHQTNNMFNESRRKSAAILKLENNTPRLRLAMPNSSDVFLVQWANKTTRYTLELFQNGSARSISPEFCQMWCPQEPPFIFYNTTDEMMIYGAMHIVENISIRYEPDPPSERLVINTK